MSTKELETLMRPIRIALDNTLEAFLRDAANVPMQPVPRMRAEADGSTRHWIDQVLDSRPFVRAAMRQLEAKGQLRIAEMLLARELGVDCGERPTTDNAWSPQRAIVEVFLEDYLREAVSTPDESPFDDSSDIAFREQVDRLHSLLSADKLVAQLIVVIGGVAITTDELEVARDVRIVPFSVQMREQLWRIAGWGSIAPQPLQSYELSDVSHLIAVELKGSLLRRWEWPEAHEKALRARQALLLAGASSARQGVSWLSHDELYASYLSRLRVGSGIVAQPLSSTFGPRSKLDAAAASKLPALYAALATPPQSRPLDLALRRLLTSSERANEEDRLIDTWIAFEALFVSDSTTELRFRASLRIARYAGHNRGERERLFAGLRRAYDWRSRLVHGGDPTTADSKKKLGALEDAVTLSESTLRAVLAQALLAGSPPQLADIDNSFLADASSSQ